MAVIHRFLCWNLRSASIIGQVVVIINAFFALVLRLVDLTAIISDDFEISQGFKTPWRSHFWQAFLASDIVLIFFHVVTIIFTIFIFMQVKQRHFVMYITWHFRLIIFMIIYIFVEFTFSAFEFSYYGMNTFRLAFVVFIWLFWVGRSIINGLWILVMVARQQEMGEQMEMELRFAGEKKRLAFGPF